MYLTKEKYTNEEFARRGFDWSVEIAPLTPHGQQAPLHILSSRKLWLSEELARERGCWLSGVMAATTWEIPSSIRLRFNIKTAKAIP